MEETLEQLQARHRKEQRDLQNRVTSKKKNATKKTRKGVNDECVELERQLKERQEEELRRLNGDAMPPDEEIVLEQGLTDHPGEQQEQQVSEVAEKLQTTTLASAAAADDNGAESQPSGPKKRNRQKERLARRAAEQEAASEAAAAEAESMPDRRALERKRMEAQFTAYGLSERQIAPDGHCMFAAVADQLAQHGMPQQEPGYRTVRQAAAGYMEAHADDFAGFVDGGESVGAHAARIRNTAEWGGQLELAALAGAYDVEIRVVQDGSTEVVRPPEGGDGNDGKGETKEIWLAYYRHDYGLGEHYNSLRKAATR